MCRRRQTWDLYIERGEGHLLWVWACILALERVQMWKPVTRRTGFITLESTTACDHRCGQPMNLRPPTHTNKTQGYSQKTVHRNVFRDTSSDIYFFYFKLKLVYSSILLSHIHTFGLRGSYKIPPNLLFEFKSKSISRTNHRLLFVPWHPWDISVSLSETFISPNSSPSRLPSPFILCLFSPGWQRASD